MNGVGVVGRVPKLVKLIHRVECVLVQLVCQWFAHEFAFGEVGKHCGCCCLLFSLAILVLEEVFDGIFFRFLVLQVLGATNLLQLLNLLGSKQVCVISDVLIDGCLTIVGLLRLILSLLRMTQLLVMSSFTKPSHSLLRDC